MRQAAKKRIPDRTGLRQAPGFFASAFVCSTPTGSVSFCVAFPGLRPSALPWAIFSVPFGDARKCECGFRCGKVRISVCSPHVSKGSTLERDQPEPLLTCGLQTREDQPEPLLTCGLQTRFDYARRRRSRVLGSCRGLGMFAGCRPSGERYGTSGR